MKLGWLALGSALALSSCNLAQRGGGGGPVGLHYVIGQPYRTASGWFYPREQFDYNDTGLATPGARRSGVTADGELADAQAMAAGHATLQLPAIVKVTNLDTGLQLLIRVNDRAAEQRGRMIALTPRAYELLGGGNAPAMRVRVQVQEGESRRIAAELSGHDVPPLPVAAAPAGAVQAEQLAPLPGARQAAGHIAQAGPQPAAKATAAVAPVPLRLPETLTRVSAHPGALYVEAGSFGQLQFAEILRARLGTLGAQTSTSYDAPRDRAYRVRIGPLSSVAVADVLLERAVKQGASDARIVAE